MKRSVMKQISKYGVIPVVVLDSSEDAEPLARALIAGGLPCAEVTFRTDAAAESIRIMARSFPEMLVGAGTVMTVEQAQTAAAAGAQFIVTPGLNEPVIEYCLANDIPVIPGVMDTYAIEKALRAGLSLLKFFPAEAAGGIRMLKAFSGPYPQVRFLPTGGISASNMDTYLSSSNVAAVGGSWICSRKMITEGRFEEITERTAAACRAAAKCRAAY